MSGSLACQDAAGPELALLLIFCNSMSFLIVDVLWSGCFRRLHVFRRGDLGVGSMFFCIITSLEFGGVVVLLRFVVLEEGCDVWSSIVIFMGAQESALCSAFYVWVGPVY